MLASATRISCVQLGRSALTAAGAAVSVQSSRNASTLSEKGKNARVTILGSGLMGNGIAQVSANAGYKVTLFDINDDLVKKGMANIQKNATRVFVKKLQDEAKGQAAAKDLMSRITPSTDLASCSREADLVVEVVVENLDVKKKVFATLDANAPSTCLFASNTSSLPIADIAAAVSEKRQAQFGGLHFFNPVPVMKLVEVVRHSKTTDDCFNALTEFGQNVGKTTVSCKDTPGFVVNRLLVPYIVEAIRMLERGDASAEDIDTAMRLGCGYPMGPLTLADYVGLDTTKFILDGWHKKYPQVELFRPCELLNKLVADGKLGNKSGEGFYKHDK